MGSRAGGRAPAAADRCDGRGTVLSLDHTHATSRLNDTLRGLQPRTHLVISTSLSKVSIQTSNAITNLHSPASGSVINKRERSLHTTRRFLNCAGKLTGSSLVYCMEPNNKTRNCCREAARCFMSLNIR